MQLVPRRIRDLAKQTRPVSFEQATQYFYELTPGRIHEGFEQAGLELLPSLRWLNSLENRVIGVEDVEGEKWVGKFYRPGRWTTEALLEEHGFMQELFEEGIPVGPPLPLDNGTTVGEIEGILFCVFPHHFGRMPDEITFDHATALGSVVAKLHTVGSRKTMKHRPRIGPKTWGLENLKLLEAEDVVPEKIWVSYEAAVRELVDRVQDEFMELEAFRIHGDLHRGNILWSSQGPSLVDFDDLTTGPAVQDLWMLLPGRDEEDWELKEAFLRSYESVREFDRDQLDIVESLRALKYVRHAAWVAKRRKDPAFIRAFPEVETDGYWRRELRDLQGQMALLGPPL